MFFLIYSLDIASFQKEKMQMKSDKANEVR